MEIYCCASLYWELIHILLNQSHLTLFSFLSFNSGDVINEKVSKDFIKLNSNPFCSLVFVCFCVVLYSFYFEVKLRLPFNIFVLFRRDLCGKVFLVFVKWTFGEINVSTDCFLIEFAFGLACTAFFPANRSLSFASFYGSVINTNNNFLFSFCLYVC